jgi:NAD(P)-dependent dehydrogenase (short-subunit alcohol dehydrogenase family)
MQPPNASRPQLAPPAGTRVLVVGGCGAIGRPLVQACADLGHDVAVLALPRSLEAHPVPPGVRGIAADVADERSVDAGAQQLATRWSGLDLLVFLVGYMTVPPRGIDEIDPAEWDAIQHGNLRSAYLTARAMLPLLRRGNAPSIVNVGSSLAYNPIKGVAPYAAAKAGLVALTKSLALENAPVVRANLVAPSAIDTPFLAGGGGERGQAARRQGGDEWLRRLDGYVDSIPLKRIAQVEDVLGPVLFLASPSASFITGQVLHVNGGRITP